MATWAAAPRYGCEVGDGLALAGESKVEVHRLAGPDGPRHVERDGGTFDRLRREVGRESSASIVSGAHGDPAPVQDLLPALDELGVEPVGACTGRRRFDAVGAVLLGSWVYVGEVLEVGAREDRVHGPLVVEREVGNRFAAPGVPDRVRERDGTVGPRLGRIGGELDAHPGAFGGGGHLRVLPTRVSFFRAVFLNGRRNLRRRPGRQACRRARPPAQGRGRRRLPQWRRGRWPPR